MISIIISSANAQLLADVKGNIAQTIGVEYEILAYDNAGGKQGICAIYNQGIRAARFPLICFMHEDIAFATRGWGRIVASIFAQSPRLGMLGIAGSTYKSLTPSGWHNLTDESTERSNLIQSFKYRQLQTYHQVVQPGNSQLEEVVAIDGVWMCARKEAVADCPFDEAILQHFHCYDIDVCLTVGKKYSIAVTYEILLHHFSEGRFQTDWIEETLKLQEKWKNDLPAFSGLAPKAINYGVEVKNFKHFTKKFRACGVSLRRALQLIYQHQYRKRLGWKGFVKCHVYVAKAYFQSK